MNIQKQIKQFQKSKSKKYKKPSRLGVTMRVFFFFIPLSVLISCVVIIMTVFIVPSVVKVVYGAISMINPQNQTQLHNSASQYDFKDITPGSPYFDAVQYLSKRGIIHGYADNTFRPKNNITKAEFIKMIVVATNQFPLNISYQKCYRDVGTEWFANDICYAKSKNWVDSKVHLKFYPNSDVTRAEMVKIIDKAFNLTKIVGKKIGVFSDIRPDDWYNQYIEIALSNQILQRNPVRDNFQPNLKVIRGSAAIILYNTLRLFQ